MAKKTETNYEEAVKELEGIVTQIENDELGIDELSEKLKRAHELLRLCKDKLTKTETDIRNILKEDGKEK